MIDAYDLYCVNQELKEVHKAINIFRSGGLKESAEILQNQIDWIDSKLLDEGICPFCGGEIEEIRDIFQDSGEEITYVCSKCGRKFDD